MASHRQITTIQDFGFAAITNIEKTINKTCSISTPILIFERGKNVTEISWNAACNYFDFTNILFIYFLSKSCQIITFFYNLILY